MLTLFPSRKNELKEFLLSFEESKLGRYYFSSEKFIKETFFEFYKKNTILTAKTDHAIIGFICYIPDGAFHSFPYIHVLTVMPEYRNQGYGKQILKMFENNHVKNASKIFLVVADFNQKAKKFYEMNGYKQVGKIPGLYRPDIDEFLMMKNLS